jgi:hypothetical protein
MKSQHQKTLDSFLGQTKKRASESTSQEEQTSKRQKVVQNTESNSSKKTDEFESTFISHLREPSWKEAIGSEFEKPYFKKLLQFIQGKLFVDFVFCLNESTVQNNQYIQHIREKKIGCSYFPRRSEHLQRFQSHSI